ncbi:MAG: glycerophosphodiester phosphodiesterase [Aromatoleum sp.]|jgi:glycerophosphoryl diester phosphodiesterase|uniref:glycerophosphodiester phosphodiesterase n=1 Tax=Aromatoleum sp. TaxID=2307007 RepID=UPI002894CEA9|nr:glycerophosphodiester phosphodiesterase [Aromatoleum sp.]MDT3672857.1 glycerophosphodiester phosphodiesterase [Aromatoleum sp.]
MSRWPLARVLAHRCGGGLAPENTLAGLDVAASLDCGGVEFDVMLSGSGSPVLIHDETLERTTDGRGYVAETPDDRLRQFDAGRWFGERFGGERIPTLKQAADRCIALGLSVNLEIKPSHGADEVTGRVVASDALTLWANAHVPPLLSSFSADALSAAAKAAPALQRGLLVERIPADWLERCRSVGAVALHADAHHLTFDVVARVRACGLRVAAYTVNDPCRAYELFGWGVDCVITDRPDIVQSRDSDHTGPPSAAETQNGFPGCFP